MTLEELNAAFAARFTIVQGLAGPKSQTGEEYHEFRGGPGPTPEGGNGVGATTEEGAIRLLYDGIMRYAADRTGTLYWRIPPEVGSCPDFRECTWLFRPGPRVWLRRVWAALRGRRDPMLEDLTTYYAYARLLISAEPTS